MTTSISVFGSDTSTLPYGSGHYIYGIIPTNEQVIFDAAGVDARDEEVYTIGHNGLAAVISRIARSDYGAMSREEAVRYLVAHQRVVEAVMRDYPVLPVKFGTVLPDEERIHRLLSQGETMFRTLMQHLDERKQMEVVVMWDLKKVFQEIGAEPAISVLRSQIAGQSAQETVNERAALGKLVKASLEQRRVDLQNQLLPILRAITQESVINPLMDDSMVLNIALLVSADEQQQLDQRLEELDAQYAQQLLFRCVGPLPPYSFATVEALVPTAATVADARTRLDLDDISTLQQIKYAYYRFASQLHPDQNPNSFDVSESMTVLKQAYEFLNAYARSQLAERQSDEADDTVDFRPEAVARTLLLSVSGLSSRTVSLPARLDETVQEEA